MSKILSVRSLAQPTLVLIPFWAGLWDWRSVVPWQL